MGIRTPSILALMFYSASTLSATKAFYITIEQHLFSPSPLYVPANEKFKLIIENRDEVAEEFDSFDLNREKVVFAGKKATLYIGPLKPGRYTYFGEFHPDTAQGVIIAEESSNAN